MAAVGDVVHDEDMAAGDVAFLQQALHLHGAGGFGAGAVAAGAQELHMMHRAAQLPEQVGGEHGGAFQHAKQHQAGVGIVGVNFLRQLGDARLQLVRGNQQLQTIGVHRADLRLRICLRANQTTLRRQLSVTRPGF